MPIFSVYSIIVSLIILTFLMLIGFTIWIIYVTNPKKPKSIIREQSKSKLKSKFKPGQPGQPGQLVPSIPPVRQVRREVQPGELKSQQIDKIINEIVHDQPDPISQVDKLIRDLMKEQPPQLSSGGESVGRYEEEEDDDDDLVVNPLLKQQLLDQKETAYTMGVLFPNRSNRSNRSQSSQSQELSGKDKRRRKRSFETMEKSLINEEQEPNIVEGIQDESIISPQQKKPRISLSRPPPITPSVEDIVDFKKKPKIMT